MNREQYLTSLSADAERIAAILDDGPLSAPVPSCPEWTLSDLGFHVLSVLRFWHEALRVRPSQPEHGEFVDVPDAELAASLRRECASISAELRRIDPQERMWTWTEQDQVSFVPRRMAQELAVHRWDAELAVGDTHPIDAELAWDGVDEYVMLSRASEPKGGAEMVRLVADDLRRSMVVRTQDGVMRVEPALSAGSSSDPVDVELAGTASDLLLVLWRRIASETLSVTGSVEVSERWLERSDLC
jgi:uncharacterized protein (TIGR03083 family)